jgi:hypothetical protein
MSQDHWLFLDYLLYYFKLFINNNRIINVYPILDLRVFA